MARLLTKRTVNSADEVSALPPAAPVSPGRSGLPVLRETRAAIAVRPVDGTAPTYGGQHRRFSLARFSFAIVVVLPVVAAALYFFLIAADQYVVEFRFALRSAEPAPAQLSLWLPTSVTSAPVAADSYVVVQYIRSRAIVDDLGRTLDLRKIFATRLADWPARLHLPTSVERLARYWRGQVDAFFDAGNGTIVVRVRAFSRHDALALAQGILGLSEELVNQMSARARESALRDSEAEVASAERRLSQALAGLRDYRDEEGLLDPNRTANSTQALADRVRDALVQTRTELSVLQRYMAEEAPSVKLLEARIQSLEEQHRVIEGGLTEVTKTRTRTLSKVIGRYEELESKLRFAENAYQHALEARDQARLNAARQQVYVADFVPPRSPEEALYPRRTRALAIVFLIAFSAWAIGGLTVRSVRDHL